MTLKLDKTILTQGLDPAPAEVDAETLAVIRASLEALHAKVAALEEADARLDNTTRRLAMDVVTLGRGLWERMRVIEAGRQDPLRPAEDGRAISQKARRRRHATLATAVVIGAAVVIAAGSALVLARRPGPAVQASKVTPNAYPAPIVVVGDTGRSAAAASVGPNRAADVAPDQSGHILYGPRSADATRGSQP